MPRFKEKQLGEPQGRRMLRPILERVIEAEEAPEGAEKVPNSTPLSDWTVVGYEERKPDGS